MSHFKKKGLMGLAVFGLGVFLCGGAGASEAPAPWRDFVEQEASSSPCLKDFTRECLLNEAARYYDQSEKIDNTGRRFVPSNILPPVNAKLAESYLARWPKDEGFTLMLLLFAAGRYSEAEQALDKMRTSQSSVKTRQDGSPIALLTFKGDLERAYELALKDMAWLEKHKQPEPEEDFYTAMHCGNQQFFPSPLPLALEILSEAFTEKGDFERAHEVAGMIKTYLKNAAYGQGSCAKERAKTPYFNAMHILADGYHKAGQKEYAQKILLEFREGFAEGISGAKTNHAYISAYLGFTQGLKELADQAALEFKPQSYSLELFDPISLLYFYAKDYERVFQRLEKLDAIAAEIRVLKEERNKKQDPFFSEILKNALLDFISPKDPPGLDAGIKTCIKMMSVARELKDFEGEKLIAQKLEEKYLGTRSEPLGNFRDYVSYAEALYAMGEREKSKEFFLRAVSILEGVTFDDDAYRKLNHDLIDMAKLYARHESVEKAINFIRSYNKYEPKRNSLYPEYWAAIFLIKEKRFEELEPLIRAFAASITTEKNSSPRIEFSLSNSFANLLLREKQFSRYLSIMDATKGSTKFDLAYVFLTHALKNPGVPDDLLKKVWMIYLDGCNDYTYGFQGKAISNEEKISNCHVVLTDQYSALQMYFVGGYSDNPARSGWRR